MWLEAVKIVGDIEDKLFKEALSLLPLNYQNKINKYLRKEDRDRALIGALLIRVMTSQLCNIPVREIEIGLSSFGKPYFLNPIGFHFNISHSGEWVVCALDTSPIGIDIEHILPISTSIADRFFTAAESEWLYKTGDHKRIERFYELWTLKESYIKAVGKGLTIPLDSFSIEMDISTCVKVNGKNESWFFRQYSLHSEYKLAVCALNNNFPYTIIPQSSQFFFQNRL